MAEIEKDARYRAYWDAIQQGVCSTCLDQKDHGGCGLSGRVCAIERHLPKVIQAIATIDSPRMDEYYAAIEAQVCSACLGQDSKGRCGLREHGECALYTYLYLVTSAVEGVNEAGAGWSG